MNRLQERRLELNLTQPQVSEKLKEIEPRADVGMVSRYEKGVCLPTGRQLSALEEIYGISRTELYDADDLDLLDGDCSSSTPSPVIIWIPVSGYEGLYEVSNTGFVRSIRSAKILEPRLTSNGYNRAYLRRDGVGKDFYVHRIVAREFIENPENKPCINHKDGCKLNNRFENLEWCTSLENARHASQTGLISNRPVIGFRPETGEIVRFQSSYQVSKPFEASTVAKCCRGVLSSHHGYIWMYENPESNDTALKRIVSEYAARSRATNKGGKTS